MATTRKLAFSGPLSDHDFLEKSTPATPPKGSRSQGLTRLASLALAGGVLVAHLAGSASASESSQVTLRVVGSPPSSVQVEAKRNTATRDLGEEWKEYLQTLGRAQGIERAVAEAASAFWSKLSGSLVEGPAPPLAGPTEQGSLIIVWDHGRHHFEVEFFPGEPIEWFYRDRETENLEGGEGTLDVAVAAARDYFNRVRAA